MDSELAATASQWAADSNASLYISLVSGESTQGILKSLQQAYQPPTQEAEDETEEEADADIIQFHPAFTYPIYGEHERVFGYKDLRINLSYGAGSLATFVHIGYSKRVDQMETSLPIQLKSDDVLGPLQKVLSTTCQSQQEFAEQVAADTQQFKPLGQKVHEYKRDSNEAESLVYEIYESDFKNEAFRKYHERLQTFVLFFIEGAQFIDDTDERWRAFTVFEKLVLNGQTSYTLVGYCTMYQFFHWPDLKRPRISQFLILPPFQGQAHGSQLYRHIYQTILVDPQYVDLTVEDPSEAFDDMRDRNDMRYLLDQMALQELSLPVATKTMKGLQQKYKISRRQLARCVEMGVLMRLGGPKHQEFEKFRLMVKQRIYAQSRDMLDEMEEAEKKQKIQESFDSVVNDYRRILSLI